MLSIKDLKYLENLSKIPLDKEKEEKYLENLSKIIDYIKKLDNLDTKKILPTTHVTNLENVVREDVVRPSMSQADALRNTKYSFKGYFKIPKIVG